MLLAIHVFVFANGEDETKFEFTTLNIYPDTIDSSGWNNIDRLYSHDLNQDALYQDFNDQNSASLSDDTETLELQESPSDSEETITENDDIQGTEEPRTPESGVQEPEDVVPSNDDSTGGDDGSVQEEQSTEPDVLHEESVSEEAEPELESQSDASEPASQEIQTNATTKQTEKFALYLPSYLVTQLVTDPLPLANLVYDTEVVEVVDQDTSEVMEETVVEDVSDIVSVPQEQENIIEDEATPGDPDVTPDLGVDEEIVPIQEEIQEEVVEAEVADDSPHVASEETGLDAYSCAVLSDCAMPILEFSGFTVPDFGGVTKVESAQLRISVGAQSKESLEAFSNLRLLYSFDRSTWTDAGTIVIDDEISNALNGGYFLFALPNTIDNEALHELTVRVAYEGGGVTPAGLYIDSVWVEVNAVSFYDPESGEVDTDEIEYERALVTPTYNDILEPVSDFLADDLPVFQFKYRSQENIIERFFEYLFDNTEEYSVVNTTLSHATFGDIDVPTKVQYNDNGTWTLSFLEYPQKMYPGKYVLTMNIEEDGHTYTDQIEFYWGVLAINSTKSMYHKGEPVSLHMAALAETGDTICHAHLALTITSPSHTVYDVPVSEGGDCGPNNVTNVPDYLAQFSDTDEIGEYHISLSHFNKEGQEVHHTKDTFEVREYIPFDIERTAPTRIYPPAPYTVSLHIKANREFSGVISEALPRGFEIVDTGGGSLATFGDENYLTWNATLHEGDELTLTYKFDAPDVSPYLYLLGPLDMDGFKELRAWQIASDALSGVAWLTGTQSENGTNLNSLPSRMLWSTSTVDTYYYRHSTSTQSERVTLRRSGDYYFAVTLPQQRGDANATFTRIGIEVRVNGVAVPQGLGRSGWIRGANSHTESSSHASFLLTNLQPDDYVEVYVQELTSIGADTVNVTGQASMYIEYIPTSNNVFAGTATSTVASTSLNAASSSPLTWTETRQDSGFVHSDVLNPENIIISNPGTYMVQVSVPLETTHSSAVAMNVLGRVLLDGAQVSGGIFSQGLAYGNAVGGSNDFYSSIHWSGIVTSTTTNQILNITTEQEASAGTTTIPTGFVGSIFIKEIPSDDTIVLRGRNLASTTNWSVTPAQKLLWDAHPVYDSVTFTHATTSSSTMGDIIVNESGDYLLSYNDALTSANTYRNSRIAIEVDGVPVSGAQTKSQLIRNAGNHNNASGALVYLLSGLSAGQTVRVMVDEEATTGGTTDDATDAVLMLWKKAALNLEPQAVTFYDTPFDGIRYSSTTPKFEFSSVDPDGTSDMVYQISWSTSTSFTASTTKTTGVDTGFTNTASSSDTSPFVEGNRIRYQVQAGDSFAYDSVYYWRVRARDVSGSGNYGDWSSIQSMTITSGVDTPDWYQTVDGQFDTNTLVGTQSNGNGSVEVIVDDNTEVLFAYAETTNTTLQYRLWNGSAWGTEQDALDVGGVINWVVTDAAPTRDEYIAGTLDANNDINFLVYTAASGTPWGHLSELTTTASNASRRGLAVAYETSSGDALAIGCDGDADPYYQIWNGSTWYATGTVNMNSVNNCEMLTLASDPTSDEIILVARDTGAQYEAQVWDGNSWLPGSSQILGSMQAGDETKEGLSVVYEASGNQAIVVTTNGSGNNFLWNSWNGSTWGSNATQALQNDFENGRLVADEGTDRIALCYINDSAYIGSIIWDGDAWGTNLHLIPTTGNDDRGRAVDCEFETSAGRDGNIIAPYSDTGVDGDYHGVYTSAWATSTGSDINDSFWVQTVRTGDGLILAMHFDDETDDIDFTYWNGTSWSTPHETLEDTPSSIATPNYETGMMAARRFVSETGTVFSNPIRHSAQSNEPTWGDIYFSTTETFGTSATLQVYYTSTTTCDTPIPNGVLSGNAIGFDDSQSPINISNISTTTYNEICLKATLVQNSGTSPTLDSWRVTWERSPIVSQNSFRWYVNGSFFTPTDPWPLGVNDLAEFIPLSSSESIDLGEKIRLRMSLNVTNVDLATSTNEFKLQYAEDVSCSLTSAWVDVGATGSTTALWRGFGNAIVGSDWYSGNWGRRVKIIVDKDLVVGSITDFPVYVNLADLPSGFFSAVQPDGDDIRVTGSNGITELPFELVSISTTSLTGELHFKANLSSTTDSEFYIYYANATATPYGATATYGSENVWTNNFEAVHHFKENPGGSAPQMYDSTGNGHSATTDLMDATNATSAQMGNGVSANGTDESVIAPGFTGLGTVNTAYGMGIWFRPDIGETDGNIIGMSLNSPPNNWRLPPLALNGGFLQAVSWTGAQSTAIGTTSVTQGSWHQGYTTWSASAGLKAYLDGSIAKTTAQATYTASGGSNYLHIAGDVAGGAADEGHFDGKIDELRVYTTSIAANWISTEFNNISNATGFYDISSEELISDGREIPSTLLSASLIPETYEEQNPTFNNTRAIPAGMDGEWDFVIENNNASSSTEYCFRLVYDNGELLDEYLYYPELITNAPPLAPTLSFPFNNEKVASGTPYFEFVSDDEASDDITYNIQIDADYTFGSPDFDQNSETHNTRFSNLIVPSDKDPFTSGQTIRYIPATSLATGTTYWWRVRAKDPTGSNTYGAWSPLYSFTYIPTVAVTTWFQTTDDQFNTDILEDATPNDSGDDVRITATYNYATVTTESIDFDDGQISRGNAWGSLSFISQNDVKCSLEYLSGSTWSLIPDADLPGNSAGYTSGTTSLLSLDTDTYNEIRIRAVLTDISGAPRLQDWTLSWGNRVDAPTLLSPFDNAKVGTTTPTFTFVTTEPSGNTLEYEFSFSTSSAFTASTTYLSSASGFIDLATPASSSPFASGHTISYTIQSGDVLTSSSTYWWRVRARNTAFSLWSEPQSFTVDESIVVSTWYQTTGEQFDTDGLTTIQGNSVLEQAEINTTLREAMVAYGEGSVQSPRYRLWDGSIWSDELTAENIGAQIDNVALVSSPTRNEYALATLGTDGDTNIQIYNGDGESWSLPHEISISSADTNMRGFDVAYETNSGDLLAVACDGTEAVFDVWNDASWIGTSTLPLSNTNSCLWVKMVSDPTSNEIILVTRSSNASTTDYEVQVWNGSAWDGVNILRLGDMEENAHEGIAVEYEESGNQAVVVVSNLTNPSFLYSTWNGSSWVATSTATGTVTLGNDFEWGTLSRDEGTDRLALCYIDENNDMGLLIWSGSSWSTFTEFETLGNAKQGRPVSCQFETEGARDGYIMIPYSDDGAGGAGDGGKYQYYATSSLSGEIDLGTIEDSYNVITSRASDGTILALYLDDIADDYVFTAWDGSNWSTQEILDTSPSVTGTPFNESIAISSRKYPAFTSGSLRSTVIDYDNGLGPRWEQVRFTDSTPGSSLITYRVYYNTSTTTVLVPETFLPGNSTGFTTSPIDLSLLNKVIHNQLLLDAEFECVSGSCPTLSDWAVEWAEGIDISGHAYEYDTSTIVTSGSVSVAVNGELQSGKTGSILGDGSWTIDNVTAFEGDEVLVFIDGAVADANEALAAGTYDGVGDMTGLQLSKRHFTIGSDDIGTTTHAGLSGYDVTDNENIFMSLSSNDLTLCADTGCSDARLIVKSNATYQPGSGADAVVHDFLSYGRYIPNGNTLRVSGSWYDYGTSTVGTSTLIFTATTSSEAVTTASSSYSFYNVTFGETLGTTTWAISKPFDVNGTLAVDYGTLSRGTSSITIAQNLRIGTGGILTGLGTTTFDGAGSYTWTDTSASSSNIGRVVIDGTGLTVTLGGNARAQSITIGSDDTLNASSGGYTLSVLGSWTNNNSFVPLNGTVTFLGTTTETIRTGGSSFNNLTFNATGTWYFASSTVTLTGNLTIATGTVTLPTGTTTITGSFLNTGGTFLHNNGVVIMNSTSLGRTITLGGTTFLNALYNLYFTGSGSWTFSEAYATTSNDVRIQSGSVTMPTGSLTIGGDLVTSGSGSFAHAGGEIIFLVRGSDTIVTNGSSLNNVRTRGVTGASWLNNAWSYRIPITISSSKVASTVSAFPVYVKLSDLSSSFFSNVKSDGGDIRITKSDGVTEVPLELVAINTGASTGELYFKGDISSSTNTTFYIYYKNAGASGYASTSTYGRNNVWTSGYDAVLHMEENPGGTAPQMTDSTSGGRSGTTFGMAAGDQVAGQFGNSVNHDGSATDRVRAGSFANLGTANKPYAVSVWFNADTGEVAGNLLHVSSVNDGSGWCLPMLAMTGSVIQAVSWTGSQVTALGTSPIAQGSWYQTYATWNATSGLQVYLNGVREKTTAQASYTASGASNYIHTGFNYGSCAGNTGTFDGKIDEVRIYNEHKPASWIQTEYNNQASTTSFYTLGGAEEPRVRSFIDTNATILGNYVAELGSDVIFPTGVLSIGGSFDNDATFSSNGGTVRFNSTLGNETISAGTSTFATLDFNSASGNFTLTDSATATAVTLTQALQFIVASSTTLTATSSFTNQMVAASTTWTGATLKLTNNSSMSLNAKAHGGDTYGILMSTGGTKVSMWNSQANIYTTLATSSIYSQDHAGTDGDLYIFGQYARTSGTEHWSYATDFDGTALSTSTSRQVDVRLASGTSAVFDTSTLSILATGTATSTIANQGTGTYSLSVLRGTTTASFYSFTNLGLSGLVLASSTKVLGLSDGAFTLSVASGTALTVSSTTIDNSTSSLQISRVNFSTTTAITGRNVTQNDGNPTRFWWFRDSSGNLFGESFDNDTGNPGSIRWDDSALTVVVSGTVYSDDGVTQMGAPTCDGSTPNVTVVVSPGTATSTWCSASNGAYSISVPVVGDVTLTTYLNTNGGQKGVIVTKTPTADISNHHIYANRVITKHQDVLPLTIEDMARFDSSDDSDIPFTAATGTTHTLVLQANTELHIASSTTFAPGGDITIHGNASNTSQDGSLHIDDNATFTGSATSTYILGGSFTMDQGATFTSASTTVLMNATTSGKTITTTALQEISFNTLQFTGISGGWNINGNIRAYGNIDVATGTVTGTGNIALPYGSFSGNGTVSLGSGTTTLERTNTLGGTNSWTFANLVLGSGSIVGTTTPATNATTTILGKLTISTAHFLDAGSSVLDLRGAGNVFVEQGSFIEGMSTVKYGGTSSSSVLSTSYYNLYIGALGGSPTYTGTGLGIQVLNDLYVGGFSTTTFTLDAQDPAFDVNGDVYITSNGTLVGSASALFNVGGSWDNDGVFTGMGGTVTFDGSGSNTIYAGNSAFSSVTVQASGDYIISENATATNAFTLSTVDSFTVTSGATLAVGGAFTNNVGGVDTLWGGSTLYLYGSGTYTINASTTHDGYEKLSLGANTQIRMWNSSATTTDLSSSASLYSMDHRAMNGALYIFGAYVHTTGTDYWSHATDFDGTVLTGGNERKVTVSIASSSSALYTGGGLSVVGSPSASTTLQNQGSGTYSMRIGGTSSASFSYYEVFDTNSDGLTFSGTPSVTTLSNGAYTVSSPGGSAITVGGTVITQNPAKTFTINSFSTTSAIFAHNVTATGTTVSSWRFTNHVGNIAGEDFDVDPNGDPGYLVWENSTSSITISGRVFSDEGITGFGASVCDGSSSIHLRVGGLTSYTTSCTPGTGAYSIDDVNFSAGQSFVVYIDGKASKAATVSLAPVSDVSDFDLYENRVIVRHEGGTPLSIADMSVWDSSDDPADIPFTAIDGAPDTLTLPSDRKLIVWANMTFRPNGNVTLSGGGGGGAHDGTLELYTSAIFDATGSETHSIGGSLISGTGTSIDDETSTFTFTTTGASRTIDTNEYALYNMTLSGSGSWVVVNSALDVPNDLTITQGAFTLPTGTTTVGGSFSNTGGSFFQNGGRMLFTSSSGETVRTGGYNFGTTTFNGAGSWTYLDTNATTTGDFTILAGTVTSASGTLTIGKNFVNAGTFTHNSGTLKFIATTSSTTVRANGSDLSSTTFAGASNFVFTDTNVALRGALTIVQGTTTLATGTMSIAGSFLNTGGAFIHSSGTILFNSSDTGESINPRNSLFNTVSIAAPTGGYTITHSATTTGSFSLTSASSFTLASSTTLTVGDVFTNLVGGGNTTWSGSTLKINSGSPYTVNSTTQGGDAYERLIISNNTDLRMWNSRGTTTTMGDALSSLYSQDYGGVNGELNIYGYYERTTGTDYWSFGTDFDGSSLTGIERAVNVRMASGATSTFSGGSLYMVGASNGTTTLTNQGSGTYGINVSGGTLNAQYYAVRNIGSQGLNISGTTTITSLSNGDLELAVASGTLMTISSTTLNYNASMVISGLRFATTTAITGKNITLTGTTPSSWSFISHRGNFDGEYFDSDGVDNCGSLRWEDSTCLLTEQATYRWRNDDGGEGVPDSEWYDANWTRRKRVTITNYDATEYANAVIKVVLPHDADMQSDFDDIRFTSLGGTTTINFVREKYTVSSEATFWVKVPQLFASTETEIFAYYGNGAATYAGVGTTTFTTYDDFEDNSLSEYSGDGSLFTPSASFGYQGTYGLGVTDTGGRTTDGLYRTSDVTVSQGETIRFMQYINTSSGSGDETCTLFGVQTPGSSNLNYGVCLEQFGVDRISLVKNAYDNDSDATILATSTVTYVTGWHEVEIDWGTDDVIDVSVYRNGTLVATTSATDGSYTSGGIGYTFWFQNGGWDLYSSRPLITTVPTTSIGYEQVSGGATWLAERNTKATGLTVGGIARIRFAVENTGITVTDAYQIEFAPKGVTPSCESVSASAFIPVPVQASCGTSAVCMQSSSEITNAEQTTDVLGGDGVFLPGSVIENPSNTGTSMSLNASTFTEVEYVVTLTSNASDESYCFRVSDNGTDIDSYSKVAELQLRFDPTVTSLSLNRGADIILLPGVTTTIIATGTVSDLNGYTDLDITRATTTMYRSGVTDACSPDTNNCYVTTGPSQCSFSNCSIITSSCTITCSADFYYYAEPTDHLSPHDGETWRATLSVSDMNGSIATGSAPSIDLMTVRALSVDDSIAYPSLEVNADTGANNATTTIENIGNGSLDISVQGTDLTDGGSSAIPAGQQRFATSTFSYNTCTYCSLLSTTSANYKVDLAKPTSTSTSITDDLFWGIAIPFGVSATPHHGTSLFTAIGDI